MRTLGMVVIRSLYPNLALVVVFGTLVWGPFVSVALALVLWNFNKWIG